MMKRIVLSVCATVAAAVFNAAADEVMVSASTEIDGGQLSICGEEPGASVSRNCTVGETVTVAFSPAGKGHWWQNLPADATLSDDGLTATFTVAAETQVTAYLPELDSDGYVTRGLFARWDGLHNSTNSEGELVFDPNAKVWIDLSGHGYDFNMYYTDAGQTKHSWTWESAGCLNINGLAAKNVKNGANGADYLAIRTCEGIWEPLATGSGVIFMPGLVRSVGKSFALNMSGANHLVVCDTIGYPFPVGLKQCFSSTYGGAAGSAPSGLLDLMVGGMFVTPVNCGQYYNRDCDGWLGSRSNGAGVKGRMSALRLYDCVLTADERVHNYITDQKRFYDSGFDEVRQGDGGVLRYRLIVDASSGATLKVNGEDIPSQAYTNHFPVGTQVTIEAVPKAGLAFNRWTGDISALGDETAAQTVVTVAGAHRIGATLRDVSVVWDYVQSGLVAMWDGEFNAMTVDGRCTHDDAATQWTDLSGNGRDLALAAGVSWASNSLCMSSAAYSAAATCAGIGQADYRAYEICFTEESRTANTAPILFSCGVGRLLTFNSGTVRSGSSAWALPLTQTSPMGVVKVYGEFKNLSDATASLFVNGVACQDAARVSLTQQTVGDGMTIGYASNTKYSFHGRIHSIRLYNRPLTDQERAANNALDEQRFRPAEPLRTLTVVATPGGKVRVNGSVDVTDSQSFTVQSGLPIRLEPIPNDDRTFSFWTGNTSLLVEPQSAGAVNVLVSRDATLTASFSSVPNISAEWYVRTGAIALWDGVDNAGMGMAHDGDATVWKDLSGNGRDWSLDRRYCVWGGSSLLAFGLDAVGTAPTMTIADLNKIRTCETVFRTASSDIRILLAGQSGSSGGFLLCHSYTQMIPYAKRGFTLAVGPTNCCSFTYEENSAGNNCDVRSARVDGTEQTVGAGTYYTCDGAVTLGGTNKSEARDFNGLIFALRMYDRVLTDRERQRNTALDLIRYRGANPADVLPEGTRLDASGTALEFYITGTSVSGSDELKLDGEGVWQKSVGGWVSGHTRHVFSAKKPDGGVCAWIGEPQDAEYGAEGAEMAFESDDGSQIRLDAFVPSAEDVHVAPGKTQAIGTLSGIRAIHIGSCSNETKAATCTVEGAVTLTAKNGGYVLVRAGGRHLKQATVSLYCGGTMKLLTDAVVGELHIPDDTSTLDLNGKNLTVRSKAHNQRAGWAGKVQDSVGGGTITWKNSGMALIIR